MRKHAALLCAALILTAVLFQPRLTHTSAAPASPTALALLAPAPAATISSSITAAPAAPTAVSPTSSPISVSTQAAPISTPQLATPKPVPLAAPETGATGTGKLPANGPVVGTPVSVPPPPRATPTALPANTKRPAAPDHISAAAIGLDSKVVTVGWHDVKNPDGTTHTEWDVASYAAGWHKNTARPGEKGNLVIAGHNNIEGEVFRNIGNLQPGDTITVNVGDKAFVYTVQERFVLPDKGIDYAQRTENARWIGPFDDERLTLVSCYPPTSNTHRVFIVAKPAK
jgi:LPXTG-site transpeptidase (sortase) family protein